MKRKPRTGHLVSLKNLGGVERHFSRFLSTMLEAGHDYHVLPMTTKLHPIVQKEQGQHLVRFHSIKGPWGFSFPRQIPGLRDAYQRALFKKLELDQLVVWNKYRNFPIVLPPDLPIVHFERGSAWFVEPSPEVKDYLSRCSGVICNSHASLRMLQLKLGLLPECPALVARNAMALPELTATHDSKVFRLGFAGRLTALKAPVVALEVIKVLRGTASDVELHIAGDGPLRQSLERLAEQWGVNGIVHFHGAVQDMSSFYQRLDAFICPSWREPFGNVVQEALAHSVPAIVGDVDGLPEQVAHGKNGAVLTPERSISELGQYDAAFVGPEVCVYSPQQDAIVVAKVISATAAAEIIESWMKEPQKRSEMGKVAREIIQNDFDYHHYCQSIADFLGRLVTDS